jgi:hypothetical protein
VVNSRAGRHLKTIYYIKYTKVLCYTEIGRLLGLFMILQLKSKTYKMYLYNKESIAIFILGWLNLVVIEA